MGVELSQQLYDEYDDTLVVLTDEIFPREHDEVVEIERDDEIHHLMAQVILEVDDEVEHQQIDVMDDVELEELEVLDYIDFDDDEVDDDIEVHEVEGLDEDEVEVVGSLDVMPQLVDDDDEVVVVIVDDDVDVDELWIYVTKQIEVDDLLPLLDEIVVLLVIDIVCIDLQVMVHLLQLVSFIL